MADTTFEWIDASGQVTDLNDLATTWQVKGKRNFHNLPFALSSYEVPLTPGETVAGVKLRARDVDLPLLVTCTNRHDFVEKVRTLVSAFNPDKGEGKLRVGHDRNSARELKCRYIGGLDGDTNGKGWSPSTGMFVLTLRAADPFFYAPAPVREEFVPGTPIAFFPFFPLVLTQGTVINTGTLNNNGDYTAWPIWTVTGPGTTLTLRNMTTGMVLQAVLSLAAGESLIIDTRPGIKTVLSGSTNYFSTLTSDSTLWGLARGNNNVQVELDGSDLNSRVAVAYYPPYLSM